MTYLKSNLNSKLVGIILGILIVGMLYLIGVKYIITEKEINDLIQREIVGGGSIVRQITQERVLYVIDKGDGDINSYQIVPAENSTVFSLLEELTERESFKIELTIYEGMGVLIENIDGARNGTDNKYWQYWVNGELPPVAADKKEIKKGDKVEWRFALVSF